MKKTKPMVSIRLEAQTRAWFQRVGILSYPAMCAWCEACPGLSSAWLANDVRGQLDALDEVMTTIHAKNG